MRRAIPLLALLAGPILACGHDINEVPVAEPGVPAPIAGRWTYYETFASSDAQLTCEARGTVDLQQSQGTFTGLVAQTGSCFGPGGGGPISGNASLSQGSVGSATLRFVVEQCHYHGDLFGDPPDSTAGSLACQIPVNGTTYTFRGTWLAVKGTELDPPTVAGTVGWPTGDTLFVPLDTFRLTLTASDDRRLLWVGYRLGAPARAADSVKVLAAQYDSTFTVRVPSGWVGVSSLTVFARDALDRLTDVPLGTVRVLNAVRRPFRSVALGARAVDLAYDAKRDVVYLVEPENATVAWVTLQPGMLLLGPPIALPMAPSNSFRMGLDVTPGDDSLVVALTGTPRLAVVDLVAGTADSFPVTGPDVILDVRAAANRTAFVFGSGSSGGFSFDGVWTHDLVSGADARRTDLGIGGNVVTMAPLARSGDATKLLVLDKGTGCGHVYDLASDAFSTCKSFAFSDQSAPTASATGNRWLVGNLLLDGALDSVTTVPGEGAEANGAIAPDGTLAYFPTAYGYRTVRLSDTTEVERVRITVPVTRVTALPDGQRLFLWSDPIGTPPMLGTNRATVVSLQ